MSETARGAIHDLGYKRYLGSRRPPSTRWRVIMRHQLAMGWRTWWRFKAPLSLAVITTFIAGGFIYFATNKIFKTMGSVGAAKYRIQADKDRDDAARLCEDLPRIANSSCKAVRNF